MSKLRKKMYSQLEVAEILAAEGEKGGTTAREGNKTATKAQKQIEIKGRPQREQGRWDSGLTILRGPRADQMVRRLHAMQGQELLAVGYGAPSFHKGRDHESVAVTGDPYSCQISTIYVSAGTTEPRTLAQQCAAAVLVGRARSPRQGRQKVWPHHRRLTIRPPQ